MKLYFQKSALMEGINIVMKAVPSKTTMTILECILIDATSGEIRLLSNDTEMAIQTMVPGTIAEPGMTAIDAKLFFEIVRKLPDNEILLESDPTDHILISCEKSRFNIAGRRGDEFVEMPSLEKGYYITLNQFTLKELIRQTIFSISLNDNNKMMTGELFEVRDNRLRVASLDGHRISIRNTILKESYEPKKVIVPGKTLVEISRIIGGEADEEVYIFFGSNHILFEFGRTIVVSRLIEGDYFRIDQMAGGGYETKITVNKKEFMDCIDQSIIFVRETDKKPLVMDIHDSAMKLSLNSMIGSMNGEISVDKTGNDLMIAFNPRFLQDALRVIDDETVDIYMVNAKNPCFIRDEDESYIYLILPVNFNTGR